jgi:pseudouridine kinase
MREEIFAAVLGGANVDIYASPSIPLRRGDSIPGLITISPGGVARNAAENLARLSLKVRLFTAFGDDPFGSLLRESCSSLGIDASSSLLVPGGSSGAYVSVQDEEGEAAAAVSSMAILDSVRPATIRAWEKRIKGASVIVADANLGAEALTELVGRFASLPIVIDPTSRTKALRTAGALRGVRAIKPNLEEAEVLCGFRISGEPGLRRAAECLHDKGIDLVFISLGAEGVFYSGREGKNGAQGRYADGAQGYYADGAQGYYADGAQGYHADGGTARGFVGTARAAATKVRNANGAGDAFTAGIAWGIVNALAPREIARFASGLAALTMKSDEAVDPALSEEKARAYMEATGEGDERLP